MKIAKCSPIFQKFKSLKLYKFASILHFMGKLPDIASIPLPQISFLAPVPKKAGSVPIFYNALKGSII